MRSHQAGKDLHSLSDYFTEKYNAIQTTRSRHNEYIKSRKRLLDLQTYNNSFC